MLIHVVIISQIHKKLFEKHRHVNRQEIKCVMACRTASEQRRHTSHKGYHHRLEWSPEEKKSSEKKLGYPANRSR